MQSTFNDTTLVTDSALTEIVMGWGVEVVRV